MKSILETVYKESMEEDAYEDLMDVIVGNVYTYDEMGQLIAELLKYHASSEHDEAAMKLAHDMLSEYIVDNV